MKRLLKALFFLALVGLGGYGLLHSSPSPAFDASPRPTLQLLEREGRPWVLWQGREPSGVVFLMEDRSRIETIGVATQSARQQVVELAGWLGSGPVRISARPDQGEAPPPLILSPREVEPYLDLLASRILRRRSEEAWRRLGRFARLYFSSGVGNLEIKKELQARLVSEGQEAGPGGARWLWGSEFSPQQVTGLPGAPRLEGEILGTESTGVGEKALHVSFPPVRGALAELEVQVEVSPTPATNYWLEVEFSTGWRAALHPAPLGGFAFQRLDQRAFDPEGTECRLRLHGSSGSEEELRVSLVGAGLRVLSKVETAHADS
jgi:hypothetical protein